MYTPFFSRVQNSSAFRRSISWFSSLMWAVLLTFWFTYPTQRELSATDGPHIFTVLSSAFSGRIACRQRLAGPLVARTMALANRDAYQENTSMAMCVVVRLPGRLDRQLEVVRMCMHTSGRLRMFLARCA